MPELTLLVIIVVFLALAFDFTNGWHDTANAIATVVGTRTLSPAKAIMMAAILNLVGALFFTEVAKAIGKEIVDPKNITLVVLLAALISVIVWNVVTVLMGIPTSSSHALIGSLIGAAVAFKGIGILKINGILIILLGLVLSPLLGALISFVIIKIIRGIFRNKQPSKVKRTFRPLQLVSAAFMAFSHGASDAQKAMGIIGMALVAGHYHTEFTVPFWVMISCGVAMALGTAMGGAKVIQTMGSRLSRLETPQGFAAETGAAILLTTIAKIGVPVSTTHTITGSIIGVGIADRIKSVRWSIATKIVYAWVLTLPVTACIAFLLFHLFSFLGL
jgi:PiT family inorganic phosphate transporter